VLGLASSDLGAIVDLGTRWQYSVTTAESVLAAVVAASVGLVGFVVTVSVLIVQMATGTFSARYMRIFYRDWAFKAVLAVLIGTFTFSYTLMRHIERDAVPNLGVTLAGAFLGFGLLLFVIFLDRAIHRLRPVAVAALVGQAGRRALREVLAETASPDAPAVVPAPYRASCEPSLVVRLKRGGAIQAIDFRGLGRWAHEQQSLVVYAIRSATSSPPARCSWTSTGRRPVPTRRTGCAPWSHSASSGRSSRTLPSPSGSWSTSRFARSRPR
jgi:uncharacterized membrane protein